MFHYRMQVTGGLDDGLWTPSVTVFEEFEQVFCHVGPPGTFQEAVVEALAILIRCQSEFGVPLRLFPT